MDKKLLIGIVGVMIITIVAVFIILTSSPDPVQRQLQVEDRCDNINFDMIIDCDNNKFIIENSGISLDDFTLRIYHNERVEWINGSELGVYGFKDVVPIKQGETREINGAVGRLKLFRPYKLGMVPVVKVGDYSYCNKEIEKDFDC